MRLVRHRGKWAASIVIGGARKRLSTGFDALPENRDSAERAAREIERSLNEQAYGQTIAEIIRAYRDDMPKRLARVVNPERILYAERAIVPFFGDRYPKDVTPDECRRFVATRRAAGMSDGTIRRELGVLRAAINWRDPNSPARFDFPPPPPPRARWLTRAEFDRLLVAARGQPHLVTFLHVAIATGARKEAILQLRWDTHIDFDKRMIWLGFKQSGKNRATVPMTDAVFRALSDARENAVSPFVIEWAGAGVADIRRALGKCYARAGLEDVKAPAHVIRHTAGAWMAQAGVPMHQISTRLGHSSIAVTERYYAHLSPDHMKQSTEALEV